MSKTAKRILMIIAVIVILAIAVFFGIYGTRIQIINTVAR